MKSPRARRRRARLWRNSERKEGRGMTPKVVTFGEVMARMEAPGAMRLQQAMPGSLRVTFAGAEVNAAVAIAELGGRAALVSAVPDNALGDACVAAIRARGVDVAGVRRVAGGRLGLYFIENGAGIRGAAVLYDRAGSAFSCVKAEDYD